MVEFKSELMQLSLISASIHPAYASVNNGKHRLYIESYIINRRNDGTTRYDIP